MSDQHTWLTKPLLATETVLHLKTPLGVARGDYLRLGNAGDEVAQVTAVNDGLQVTVLRGVKGRAQSYPLLDFVWVDKTFVAPSDRRPDAELTHRPVPGDEFMPAGWCGGCETCSHYSVPTICLACSYQRDINPEGRPVLWEDCTYELPKAADGRTVAAYRVRSGDMTLSILGSEALSFSPEDARKLIVYLTRVQRGGRHR